MCGIVFKYNFDKKKPVNNDILQQYDKQSHRGQRGFGVFDGQYMNIIRESREDNILKWLVKKNSNLILFHHRLPTSTVNVAKAAHPFSTKKYFGKVEYILCHNGVIRNANELWTEHQRLGIRYTSLLEDLSFNDSEALLWDFALTMQGKQDRMKAHGNMAFICMKKVNGKLVGMFFGRNTNPLNVKRTAESLEIASEGPGVSILSNMLYYFDFKTHITSKAEMDFPVYKVSDGWYDRKELGTYPNSGFHTPTQQSLLPAGTKQVHAVNDAGDNEEYDSYDDWHNRKYGVTSKTEGAPPVVDPEENWLRLRRKYGTGNGKIGIDDMSDEELIKDVVNVLEDNNICSAGAVSIGRILDAKRDKSGKFVVQEAKHTDMGINMDDIDLRDYSPTSAEIQKCAIDYMMEADGVFEDAHSLLENGYIDYQEELTKRAQTFDDIRQMLLMEATMHFIESDDEYQNEKSVSSMWRALCQQRDTAMAV